MSRSIWIGYEDASGKQIAIEIPPPYYLLGTQDYSMRFWRIAGLKEAGIERLTLLGEMDPVNFAGWDDLVELGHEIELLAKHLPSVKFDPDLKARWLSHLTYCYQLLVAKAPKGSTLVFSIG